jgi:hypothetical protein
MKASRLVFGVATIIANILVLIMAFGGIQNPRILTASQNVSDFVRIAGVTALMSLVYFVWTFRGAQSKSRVGTLIGLWFDAKERELRERGKPGAT